MAKSCTAVRKALFPFYSREREIKHVKPLEYQNRNAIVMENSQYTSSFSANCPSSWWSKVGHSGDMGQGMQDISQ